MSNIVKFPRASKPPAPEPVQPAAPKAEGRGLVAGLVKFVWVATVLVWPVLKWVLAIITFFQFVRMLYQGLYAGIPEISVSPAPVPPRAHPGR